MLHLLPEEYKKRVLAEYRKRLFSVILFAVAGVSMLGVVSLIPAFVYVELSHSSLAQKMNRINDEIQKLSSGTKKEGVKDLRNSIRALAVQVNRENPSDIIKVLTETAGPHVHLTRFVVISNQVEHQIDLTGVAETREDLVAFSDALRKKDIYKQITIPLTSFAQRKNLQFNVKLVSKPIAINQASSSSSSQ